MMLQTLLGITAPSLQTYSNETTSYNTYIDYYRILLLLSLIYVALWESFIHHCIRTRNQAFLISLDILYILYE